MSRKLITLGAAEFLDSPEARALAGIERSELKRVAEAILTAAFGELGSAPHLLDGDGVQHLMREALPGHLRAKDPLAERVPEVLAAFFAHVESTQLMPHAFEVRQALANHEDAFLEAVRSGTAERRAGPRQDPVVHKADKVGRNDPCLCGSGKKFKKCCGRDS